MPFEPPEHGRVVCSQCDKRIFECADWRTHSDDDRANLRRWTLCDECGSLPRCRIRLAFPTWQPKAWGWHKVAALYVKTFDETFPKDVFLVSSVLGSITDDPEAEQDENTVDWRPYAEHFKRMPAEKYVNVVIGFADIFERFWTGPENGCILNLAVTSDHPRKCRPEEIEILRKYLLLFHDHDHPERSIGKAMRIVAKGLV